MCFHRWISLGSFCFYSHAHTHIYFFWYPVLWYVMVCVMLCNVLLCMYVCTYVRMYVCMYVCMYVFMYVCMYVCKVFRAASQLASHSVWRSLLAALHTQPLLWFCVSFLLGIVYKYVHIDGVFLHTRMVRGRPDRPHRVPLKMEP